MEFIVDMLLFYSDSKYFQFLFSNFSFNCFFLILFLLLTYVLLL